MASIVKRTAQDGSVSYRVQVRIKGFPSQSATFARLTDAKRWEQETEVDIRSGKYFKGIEAKKHSFAEMIDRYLAEIMPLKPQCIPAQKKQLNWWKDQLGDYMLADVTASMINEKRHMLAGEIIRSVNVIVEGKTVRRDVKRAPATVNRYTAALSHAFSVAAIEWEWLENSPMRKVRKLKEPRGRIRFLSDNERDRLITTCKENTDTILHIALILALGTGARKMEILGLRWQDVDFKRKVITLQKTKNGEIRVLPLTGYGLQLLEAHAAKEHSDTDFVFPNKFGTAPVSIKRCWKTAVKEAGIDNFRFHDLRHSAASYLAMNGASLPELAEVLGHKTLAMVKRYAHLSEPHTINVVSRMNDVIFKNNIQSSTTAAKGTETLSAAVDDYF